MLCATTSRYAAVFEHTIVVLRPDDSVLETTLRNRLPQVSTVTAADAELGMGHSLAAGIGAAKDWQGAFVALADMPFVQLATLRALREALEESLPERVVLPTFSDRDGHPVGFPARCFPELTKLQGDRGARAIIEREDALRLPVDDPGVLKDLDRPEAGS